ncbi:hypothetical protein CP971_34480 [Streptomyces viridifaciens]|nr:hypothetical protein CP971_34480 [Streptomyces viridifaciens]
MFGDAHPRRPRTPTVPAAGGRLYMDAAPTRLRADGQDVARPSPFVRHHVDMLGRYSFLLPEMPGGLRPSCAVSSWRASTLRPTRRRPRPTAQGEVTSVKIERRMCPASCRMRRKPPASGPQGGLPCANVISPASPSPPH